MSTKVKSDYTVLCVIPGALLGDSPPQDVVDSFQDIFNVRITDVEEVTTLHRNSDGTERVDILFKMHDEDVSKFAVRRFATDVKWWGDWMDDHRKDYPLVILNRFKEFEF